MKKISLIFPGSRDCLMQEAYKTLRTNLQFCGKNLKTVMLTDCHENTEKAAITLNLARSIAELGKKVLIIEADMRHGTMASAYSREKESQGLCDVLTGAATFRDTVCVSQMENLHILFSGQHSPNPAELLGGACFAALLNEVRQYYDYILLDTPSLQSVIDAAVIAPQCDGTIILMADHAVGIKQADAVVRQLKMVDSEILGVVRYGVSAKHSVGSAAGYYGESQ